MVARGKSHNSCYIKTPKIIFVHNSIVVAIFEWIKQDKASFTHGNVWKFFYELDSWFKH